MAIAWLYALLLVALTALSVQSLVVLRAASPWTSIGWLCTIGYDLFTLAEIALHLRPGLVYPVVPYAFLVGLVVAFTVAGLRDEAQADPWWWPRGVGPTRAERRRAAP